jgi:hypothetical protein
MKKKNLLTTIIVFSVIFLCHFVVFLAFYPGICTYDLNTQIDQYINHAFLTNHPLVHTLFVGFFHNLFTNDINLGYAFATVIQLLIVNSSMTYSVLYLKKCYNKRSYYILATFFYAVFPTNSLLAISHTKDVLFAAFALIFFIDSIRFIKKGVNAFNPVFFIRMTINATLMLLLRNNAIYAMLATIIIIFIICFVSHKKMIATKQIHYVAILFLSLMMSVITNRVLVSATEAGSGSIKEMMAIPAQIMGRVYNTTATEQEKEIISSYIPNTEDYNYYLADPMKRNLPFEIWESKCKHFLLDSTIIAIKHPWISIQAVWYNIQGYFDPFHQPYSSDHFFLARHDYSGDAVQDTKLPKMCDLYVDHFRLTNPSNPLSVFLNMAIYVWIYLIAFYLKVRDHDKSALSYLFALLYLATLLLGPGAIIRYGFFFILVTPITMCTVLSNKGTTSSYCP